MAEFKLCISTKDGKTLQKEVKDAEAQGFIGLNIKETIKGEKFGATGYELQITGGSDKFGFPMRSGIMGIRKRVNLLGGVGFKGAGKGIKRKKTVCGHKISDSIAQINLKVVKEGPKKLAEALGVEVKEEEKKESPKKETPKEEPKPSEKNEEKPAEKKEELKKEETKKEENPKEDNKESPKEGTKPAEKKESPKKEDKSAEKKEDKK